MTTTKQYDYLNRLTSISSTPSISHAYQYNAANQRTTATLADSSYWVYTFDSLGQVTSGRKYWPDGSAVAGQQLDYSFDDIGNRTWTTNNSRPAQYLANRLNQYTRRDVPGFLNALGSANSNATVTLWADNGLYAPTSRKGEYFRGELPANNSTNALWLTMTNLAVLRNGTNADIMSSVAGNVFLPKTPELFGYDADGNLTSDGRWTYTWDGENRLIGMTSLSTAPAASKLKLDFTYDYQGRRNEKTVSVWSGSSYVVTQDKTLFVYDGWNLLAELDAGIGSPTALRTYMWGLDLSGSPQGAGGVGGLLAIYDQSTVNGQPSTHFVANDGNGNVVALVNGNDGIASAQYEYGPFGELLRATGPLAALNPFLFQTEFYDWETGKYYWKRRYYDPVPGTWLSRDPLEEDGGMNLYGFCGGDSVNGIDLLGMVVVCNCPDDYFAKLGLRKDKDYRASGNNYSALPGTSFSYQGSLEKEIVWKMLLASTEFKAKGLRVKDLQRHVAARQRIVNNALKADFQFDTGHQIIDWTGFSDNPQAFFDRINNGKTVMACQLLSRIIFETGNNFGMDSSVGGAAPTWSEGRRDYDGLWIPGDWGWIRNRAYTDNDDWKDQRGRNRGVQGENVIYTGGGLFWGHFEEGKHSPKSEDTWWRDIKRWTSRSGKHGDPEWRSWLRYPVTGLEQ
jgi:RHS repeat-associated protein